MVQPLGSNQERIRWAESPAASRGDYEIACEYEESIRSYFFIHYIGVIIYISSEFYCTATKPKSNIAEIVCAIVILYQDELQDDNVSTIVYDSENTYIF